MVPCSNDSMGLAALPTQAVEGLAARIEEIAARMGEAAPDLAARLRKIAGAIGEEQVTVNFGGVFKAGKSTMMNAVVGRGILPVDDVPETGAICCLLSGEEDSAVVVESGARRAIECTTEAIRAEITLLSAQGERRGEVAAIERAEIVLKKCVIPRDACWVDSPGYNDTAEMDERTRRSAAYADVLAWVLTSRQLLSQVEMEFLSTHIRESGPASVLFILNGFLRSDTTEEWEQFLSKSAPQLINKVRHFGPDMGFPEQAPPAILPVAGRAMCKSGQNSFGGAELLRFMVGVDSRFHPRVMRTRLWRASARLRDCAAQLDDPIARAAEEFERRKNEMVEGNRRAEGKRRLAESLTKIVGQFLEEFSTGARACETNLAARMTNVAVVSGGIHAAQWNREIGAIAEAAARRMLGRTSESLRRQGQTPVNQEWMEYFVSLTRPPAIYIQFPEQLESGGVNALVAAIPAFVGEKLDRPPQWLATVRSEIHRQTENIITAMQSRRTRLIEGFDRLYSLQAADLPAPDETALRRLEESRNTLRELADEAAKLAAPNEAAGGAARVETGARRMNTLGVDYQPTVTVMALREEGGKSAQVAPVGDGIRSRIPNAIARDGAWGSRADGHAGVMAAPSGSVAWVEEPGARRFWGGLYSRLCSYLGRMAPVRRNGYRIAVALQGANYRTEAHAVAALARAAGFDEVMAIPATHALLCRWLASPVLERERAQVVVSIVGGRSVHTSLRIPARLGQPRAAVCPVRQRAGVYRGSGRRDVEPASARSRPKAPERRAAGGIRTVASGRRDPLRLSSLPIRRKPARRVA